MIGHRGWTFGFLEGYFLTRFQDVQMVLFFGGRIQPPSGFWFLVAADSTEKSCDTWLCSDLSLSKACLAERFCLRCDFLELCGVILSLNFCGVFFFVVNFEGVPSRTWADCVFQSFWSIYMLKTENFFCQNFVSIFRLRVFYVHFMYVLSRFLCDFRFSGVLYFLLRFLIRTWNLNLFCSKFQKG